MGRHNLVLHHTNASSSSDIVFLLLVGETRAIGSEMLHVLVA